MSAPNLKTKLRVVDIALEWDMRSRHPLRNMAEKYGYRAGEVLLAFNRRRTMVRLVDSALGVHDYYSPDGSRFDVDLIADVIAQGLKLEVTLVREAQKTMHVVDEAA